MNVIWRAKSNGLREKGAMEEVKVKEEVKEKEEEVKRPGAK